MVLPAVYRLYTYGVAPLLGAGLKQLVAVGSDTAAMKTCRCHGVLFILIRRSTFLLQCAVVSLQRRQATQRTLGLR